MIRLEMGESKYAIWYLYSLGIESLDEIDTWFATIADLDGLTIDLLELEDTFEKSSEGGGLQASISVEEAKNNLADFIRETHADNISTCMHYKGARTLHADINCIKRTLFIGTCKKDKSTFDELDRILTTVEI